MRIRFYILLFYFIAGNLLPAMASHIVGGEVTYVCLGNNNYKIILSIYEDCLNGDPQAIAQDNPAYICIYRGSSLIPSRFDSIRYANDEGGNILVPTNFSNSCVKNAPPTCLRKKTFTETVNLPADPGGYTIVYQRCCRNASILNLANPSRIGTTYFCTIPSSRVATCNNSAVFKNYPPQIICIKNPLYYDHSATDPDGDSLSYEFCETYIGGSDNDARPIPAAPPYTSVIYNSPFSYQKPMAGYPPITIDPVTGLITGTPNLLGRYVVTVCCNEWRNGVKINTVKREFQFVVTNCSKAVIADIPQYSTDYNTYIVNCRGYDVSFVNQSKGGFSYYWDFGANHDTSTLFEPAYTYPDTGTYYVKLVVNKGTTCPDSITRAVKIYPQFHVDFQDSGLKCPGTPIQFSDLTTSTFKPIKGWSWSFGDGTASEGQNPIHTYTQGGTYNVLLMASNSRGCSDTTLRQVVVEKFNPFAGNDTIIVKGESINFNASGGMLYTWTPAVYLSATTTNNPTGYYPDTGTFKYSVHIVSAFGCVGDATMRVLVVDHASFFIPTAFTPNGDGNNDVFRPVGIGYRALNYFKVFNRWGQEVFLTNTLGKGWDGKYQGQKMEAGTYYWEISSIDRFGNQEKRKGDVTLIR